MAGPNIRLSGFYFITDSRLTVQGVIEDVRQALIADVVLVQYREKDKSLIKQREEAQKILAMCREANVPFIMNDFVELAREIGANGVHVGQEDTPFQEARKILGPGAIIGVSVGDVEEAMAAEAMGADYVAIGSVFPTSTKPDAGEAVGIEKVRAVRAAIKIPLCAIGGINKQNSHQVLDAGADLICAISASLEGGRVKENIRELTGR